MIGLYFKAVRELGLRVVVERLRRLAIDLAQTFGCETCGATWPEMFPFMVKDDLWVEIVGDEEAHQCLYCFEEKMLSKIGRTIVPEDFIDVPINNGVLCGVKVARGLPLGSRD